MTLIVSLRVPDGIVIAGDSYSSVMAQVGVVAGLNTVCPKCNKNISLKDVNLPPVPFRSTTYSHTQKVFSFFKKAGIGAFGTGAVNGKTVYRHIKELERRPEEYAEGTAKEIVEKIGQYFHSEFVAQDKDFKKKVGEGCPLGFQYVTCEDGAPKTHEIFIRKEVELKEHDDLGCTVSGDTEVVTTLWQIGRTAESKGPNIPAFSLQDAIDYAEFLINTTAQHQKYSRLLPAVGGEIDIGLITPFGVFKWKKLKPLTRLIEQPNDMD